MAHMHGTYDTRGVFTPQTVRPGVTPSGQHGLFSCGFLAHPMSREAYDAFRSWPQREQRAYANARGFELETTTQEG